MTGELGHGWTCPDDPDIRGVFGCDGTEGQEWHIDETIYRGCPLAMMTDPCVEALLAWRLVASARLWPAPGGQDQQSAWFLAAVLHLDGERSKFEEREAKRRSKPAWQASANFS